MIFRSTEITIQISYNPTRILAILDLTMIFAVKIPKLMSFIPEDELIVEDVLDIKVFSAIEQLVINQIQLDSKQITQERFKLEQQRELKVIYQGCKDFLKNYQQRLSNQTIQEMVDAVFTWDIFLPTLKTEYLTGTLEEKDKIIEELDCEKLNKDTYALVTSYLRRKNCLKRSKGFGKL